MGRENADAVCRKYIFTFGIIISLLPYGGLGGVGFGGDVTFGDQAAADIVAGGVDFGELGVWDDVDEATCSGGEYRGLFRINSRSSALASALKIGSMEGLNGCAEIKRQ